MISSSLFDDDDELKKCLKTTNTVNPSWMAQPHDRWNESSTFHRPTNSCAAACLSTCGSPHVRLLSEGMRRRQRLWCLWGALSWWFPKESLLQTDSSIRLRCVAVASPCMMSTSFAQLTHDLDAYYFLQVDGTCSCKHDRAGVDCSLVRTLFHFSH